MRYAILGTTQALRDDGTPVALPGGRLRALLTALALRPGRVVGAEALIGEVWDGDPPAEPTGALQALVGRLRRAIGHDAVGSAAGGYRLAAAPEEVDLHRFERLAGQGARALADGDPVTASGLLGDALALWRGPALADLPDRGPAAVRIDALHLDTRRLVLTADLALGRADRILPDLAELTAAHPLDEPLRALHIRALHAVGRTADALTSYESFRRALAARLGTDPAPELRSLHAELLAPGPAPAAPAARLPAGPPDAAGPPGPVVPGQDGAGGFAPYDRAGVPGGGDVAVAGAVGAGPGGPVLPGQAGGTGWGVHRPDGGPAAAGVAGMAGPPAPGQEGGFAPYEAARMPGVGDAAAGAAGLVGSREPAGPPAPGQASGFRPGGFAAYDRAGMPGGGEGGPTAAGPGPARRTGAALPGNARARLTSFVGREGDLEAVRGDLARARLVTITGPGGTGKTRLSQEAGDLVAARWPDGVWYAELAPVSDPRTVAEAVISSLGLRETLLHSGGAAEAAIAAENKAKDPAQQLTDYCASRELLLVLDNCEHVIDAAAALTEQLLAGCPGVTVLATSREPLGVPGEVVRPLDPLPDPTALRLLADRGAAARPGFSVEDDPVACAELCRRLDGLPLAIELAAARLRSMTPRQLADRLDDRFRLLTGGSRTLLPRQQTLRAVVDWSWDLLDPAERVLLRRLAVFRGGWTLEAAEAICADAPEPSGAAAGDGAVRTGDRSPYRAGAADGGRAPGADGRPRVDAAAGPPPGRFPSEEADRALAGPDRPTAGDRPPYPDRTAGPDRPQAGRAEGTACPEATHPEGPAHPETRAPRIGAADAAALLASLVDKSLVLADLSADGPRHRMLETIAEYAAERLDESGERAAVERQHITYFREFARTADPRLRGAGQLAWFERLERDHENLRAALRRAVAAGDEQEALLLVLGCAWFWEVRNYTSERRHWPAAVAAMGPDPFDGPPALEPLDRGPLDDPPPLAGERLLEARRWARVVDLAAVDGAVDWWTDPRLARIGRTLIDTYPPHLPQSARWPGIYRAYGAFFAGRFDQLHRLLDETVASCRAHGRTWELAYALQLRAKINNDVAERLAEALHDIGESRRLFERLGDEWGTAETLSAEAEAAGNGGDWSRAIACCREGIALARRIGSHQHVPVLTVRLGDALVNAGHPEEGERLLREGIEDAQRFGAALDGAVFFGRIMLAQVLTRRSEIAAALDLIETAIAAGASGVPGFVTGMLLAMKGYLVGRSGDPGGGLRLLADGIDELAGHPLADVVAPRLGILMAPGAAELLTTLAAEDSAEDSTEDSAPDSVPSMGPDAPAQRRARRAAALLGAHDRLRPSAMPPAERDHVDRVRDRLRALLGPETYDAAYAEGGGLGAPEAVALMRDVR